MFNIDQIINALKTDPAMQRNAMTGAAGLAAGLLLGGGGKRLGDLAKLGAVAAVGTLAYNAWQQHQRNKGGAADPAATFSPPASVPGAEHDAHGKAMVRAMIAAAKADGTIDAEERQRIFGKLETMQLGPEEKAFVFDELSAPLDIEAVVAGADTPQHAAELYAASLVAMRSDTPEEAAYLSELAFRLNLDAGLVAEIHKQAAA